MIKKILDFIRSLFTVTEYKEDNENKDEEKPIIEIIKEEQIPVKYEEKDGKIIFNVSKGKENFSQRNNEFKWTHPKNPAVKMDALSMCNVTSMVMALAYLGYTFPTGKFKQPEDNLCDFMFTDKRVMERYKTRFPAMWAAFDRGDANAFGPNLVHDILSFATNLWMGCTSMTTFNERMPITDIIKEIVENNRPLVLSGTFPYTFQSGTVGTLGHINVLVGAIWDKSKWKGTVGNSEWPETLIFDDPFGDYKINFRNGTGNDVMTSWADFIRLYKDLRNTNIKMAHTFKSAAATI
jgi:hypothetical protein